MFFLLFFYHHIYIIHKYHITCRTQTPSNGFFLHFYPFMGNLFKNMIFFFNTRCSSRSLWIAGCPCHSGNLNGIVLILITFFSWFSTSSMLNCVSLFLLHWEICGCFLNEFVDIFGLSVCCWQWKTWKIFVYKWNTLKGHFFSLWFFEGSSSRFDFEEDLLAVESINP